MDQTLSVSRGFTGTLSKAGLALGDGAKTGVALAAPNGAGLDFAINGIAYHKADAATNLPLSAGTVQPVLTECLYLIVVDSALAVTSVQGVPELTADLDAGTRVLQYPECPANKCPVGAVKIVLTSTATFTPGTTALDAANVTESYIDFAGGMPVAPIAG